MKWIDEDWRDVLDYPGYQVSSLGRIRSNKYGDWRFLKPGKNRHGYLIVVLHKGGIGKTTGLHRITINAFRGKSNLQVNHKDFDKTNNRISNLEYMTGLQNTRHYLKYKKGVKLKTE